MSLFNTAVQGRPARFGSIFAPDSTWLALQPAEPVIEPDIPIVDAHHHLWDRPQSEYLIRQYAEDVAGGHAVVKTVYLESGAMSRAHGPAPLRPVGETEFAAGMAAMSESGAYGPAKICAGIVGFADLRLGAAVEEVLAAHLEAGNGRFRGVRFAAGWDASPEVGNSHDWCESQMMLRDDVISGLHVLSRMGLSLDAWVFHPQLGDVQAIAEALPGLDIVVGHCGGPLGYGPYAGREKEVFEVWRASMARLAKYPNVSVKLGGMMMRLAAFDYRTAPIPPSSELLASLWRPYVETCVELFGAQRCMFESNFPVEKMGTGYTVFWNAMKRIVGAASVDEKRALFSGTASRFYRLD